MSTIANARPFAENLEQRLEFETLISDLSSRFINLPPGEVDREIDVALRRMCEALDIDLAILWQWSQATPGLIAPIHVYHAQEGARPSEPMRQDLYPWTRLQMLAGRLVDVSSLEALPVEASRKP
jgi:formate hydrogenlyase transcriptional activator